MKEKRLTGKKTENRKKGVLRLVLLAGLLAAAAALWWLGRAEDSGTVIPSVSPSPVVAPSASLPPRNTREAAYEKDMATLQALLQKEDLPQETRQQAAAQIALMTQQHQQEIGIEEALIHTGFSPCLVLMQNGALTVLVNAPSLTAAESAAILAVCMAHSDISAENVRIVPGGV